MTRDLRLTQPAEPKFRRAVAFNGGFFTQKRLRRILALVGLSPKLGWPTAQDTVLLWGQRPTVKRGTWVAQRTGAQKIYVEDAFFRSLHPGRAGDPPGGLLLDHQAPYFDANQPSDLETLLQNDPLKDPVLLQRAETAMARIARHRLTKYSAVPKDAPCPPPGFVLVIDQTQGDAAITHGAANADTFEQMLAQARQDHPERQIVIKTHPETTAGLRTGYFGATHEDVRTSLFTDPVAPQALFDRAHTVYVVTSQLGFEAILAGHRPKVFGQPFYAGWGLSDDQQPLARRNRTLTAPQLFAGAVLKYPIWYDSYRDQLVDFEIFLDGFIARTRAWREDHKGWNAKGIRLWKRGIFQKFFKDGPAVHFEKPESLRPLMAWGAAKGKDVTRVEDGFLRSKGLGASLVPPQSLILDDTGIYFDPSQESRLEQLIAASVDLAPDQRQRADSLQQKILNAALTKYNLGQTTLPAMPKGRRILVPGQVEDDASIRLGTRDICTNLDLLRETRAQNPGAIILYKPHPDVEAGLRPGKIGNPQGYADIVLTQTDPHTALAAVDEVWTMTSLIGFEALMRGVKVTCLGQPFYAGWGLTTDRHPVPRRTARPDLTALIYATLIAYPRYFDRVTGQACPPEVTVERLQSGTAPKGGAHLRLLAKLQGLFASQAYLWRK